MSDKDFVVGESVLWESPDGSCCGVGQFICYVHRNKLAHIATPYGVYAIATENLHKGGPRSVKKGAGYHLTEIKKGQLGELSKIQEELDEARDAEAQSNRIMTLLELSDLVGAVDSYLKSHFPGFHLADLVEMA